MKFIELQRYTSVFLVTTFLVALYILFTPGASNDWILDPLTGVVALAAGMAVCARLALGSPSKAVRQLWQVVLVLLGLVCVSQFAEPFGDHIERYMGIEDIDDGLMLVAAPLLLWVTARFDPIPIVTRRVIFLAFFSQVFGALFDLADDGSGPSIMPMSTAVGDFFDLLSMQLYLLAATLFVAALRWQIFAIYKRPSHVGDIARHLFVTRRLFKEQRYPRIGNLPVPGGKLTLGIARFFAWFFRMAPRIERELQRSVWQQLLDICFIGFRHGLDAEAYYMFEMYRAPARARAAGFLTRYETKNGLLKVLNWQLSKLGHRTFLGDKLIVSEICEDNGIPHIAHLIFLELDHFELLCESYSDLEQDLFIKPRQSKGARGTELLRYSNGKYMTQSGDLLSLDDVFDHVAYRGRREGILVQPRIRNHPELAAFAEQSLVVIRVMTCLDDAANPVVTHGMLRVLSKLEPRWGTNMELGAPIDVRTGVLGQMTGDKAEMALDWYSTHPFTGAAVEGQVIPHWADVRDIALKAHAACGDRLLVGWDIAVSPTGAMLVEGNSYADVDFIQRVHRCPIGDSPLGPLLFSRLIDLDTRISSGTLRGPVHSQQ